jgi:hypothetical protein
VPVHPDFLRRPPPALVLGAAVLLALSGYIDASFEANEAGPLITSRHHPADTNQDWRIAIGKLTAYGAAWRRAEDWPRGPSPVSITFLTRAGFLGRNGGNYRHDPLAGAAPSVWVSSRARVTEPVLTWIVPDTPGGMRSNQNWHATGSTPLGDIYVAGMDHKTNSALFSLPAGDSYLTYVGDARAASEAADNWAPGETAEKFHTRPTWNDGRVYVATLDYSMIDDGYLDRRGFHWYSYHEYSGAFVDLSVAEPGGVAIDHGGLATISLDPQTGLLWGATIPGSRIVSFDPVSGITTDLGRPPAFGPGYNYTTRFLWVDSGGRVYFTGGNPAWEQKEPVEIFGHVHFYDPATGFGERPDWPLETPTAIETGQWTRDRQHCFVADDLGRFYRFDDAGPAWSSIGALEHDGRWVWVTHLSADGRSIYAVNSGAGEDALYEFDVETGATVRLASLAVLHPNLAGRTRHTGYDAWDRDGRFYFTSFPWPADTDLLLTGIDPVRLKVELGLLPGLVEIGIAREENRHDAIVVRRSGSTVEAQEVLFDVTARDIAGNSLGLFQETLVIPAGPAMPPGACAIYRSLPKPYSPPSRSSPTVAPTLLAPTGASRFTKPDP